MAITKQGHTITIIFDPVAVPVADVLSGVTPKKPVGRPAKIASKEEQVEQAEQCTARADALRKAAKRKADRILEDAEDAASELDRLASAITARVARDRSREDPKAAIADARASIIDTLEPLTDRELRRILRAYYNRRSAMYDGKLVRFTGKTAHGPTITLTYDWPDDPFDTWSLEIASRETNIHHIAWIAEQTAKVVGESTCCWSVGEDEACGLEDDYE